MRALLLVGGGILIGAGFVHAEATVSAEKRAAKKFEEQLEIHKRVLNTASEEFLAANVNHEACFDSYGNRLGEGPHLSEEYLDWPDTSDDAVKVGGEMVQETSISNVVGPSVDYLERARTYSESPTAAPVSPVGYITEDEYHEEDGRAKEQILIHMGEDEPLFINEGIIMTNWREVISPNILVDMYQMVPPGSDTRVLYVRNNRNDTDYEVIQEIP